jgi:hypothetical protein
LAFGTRGDLLDVRVGLASLIVRVDKRPCVEPPTQLVASGLADPITRTLGLRPPPRLEARGLLNLLRADADVLRMAATPEGDAAARQDKAEQFAAYREKRGEDPPEWTYKGEEKMADERRFPAADHALRTGAPRLGRSGS